MFSPQKALKKTRIKLHNTLALPVLLYGSETWTIKASDARRITATEMKYMRRTAWYTWTDYITNAHIAKELKITPILDILLEYKRSWIQHVNRMVRNRLPRVMKHYSPTGTRKHVRPLKWLFCCYGAYIVSFSVDSIVFLHLYFPKWLLLLLFY